MKILKRSNVSEGKCIHFKSYASRSKFARLATKFMTYEEQINPNHMLTDLEYSHIHAQFNSMELEKIHPESNCHEFSFQILDFDLLCIAKRYKWKQNIC